MAEVKTYSKSQLAAKYKVAVSTLVGWFDPFINELENLDYRKEQKILNPNQVKLIFDKLGMPE